MTIALDRARAVLAMRAAGATHLKIVEKLGIARSTVRRILRGESPHELPEHVPADPDPGYAARPVRCACGRLVILQPGESRCLACRLGERCPPVAIAAGFDVLAGVHVPLDLKPSHRARYEALRRRRIAADAATGSQLDTMEEPTDDELARLEQDLVDE